MATSFSTLSFTPQRTQRPVTFVPYNGPKAIDKSAPVRTTRDDQATGIAAPLASSTATSASQETTEPSGPVSGESTIAMADSICFETQSVADRVGCGRDATIDPLAEERVSTGTGEGTTDQDDWQLCGDLSSTQRIPESQQKTPTPNRMESDGAEFDYLFDGPTETYVPVSSRSRSLSQSDPDADTSDASPLHHSSQRSRQRRKRSYPERSIDSSHLLSVDPESSTSEGSMQGQGRHLRGEKYYPPDHNELASFAIDRKLRPRKKGGGSVGNPAADVFVHRTRLRDTLSEVSHQKTNNLQTSGRAPQIQPTFRKRRRVGEASTTPPLEPVSRVSAPERRANENFGHAAFESQAPKGSSASRTSLGRLAATQAPSVVTCPQFTWSVARELCIQAISPDLSLLVCILPDLASVQALIHRGDGHGPVAGLGHSDALGNVIVKQLGPKSWLVLGTVRTKAKVSFMDTCPEDDLSDQGLESASAGEDTTSLSNDESEERFLAKNQRWSEKDDRLLSRWVQAGRPWRWITQQFPLRTPGSVRTRYSTLQRKCR